MFNAISLILIIKRGYENLIHHNNIIKFIINKIIEKRNPIIKIISKIFACTDEKQPPFLSF